MLEEPGECKQFPGEADTELRLRISETVLDGEGAEKAKTCHRERENGR